jgi:RNA polymerase sigma-70 factor (ECF subfamily)
MSTVVPEDPVRSERTASGRSPDRPNDQQEDWVLALSTPGAQQVAALRSLHGLMVRASAHQVWRMRAALADPSPDTVDDIANQAADVAMTAVLAKLHTFQGRSRFTTWAYKFAILQAATEVRRLQWQHREVELRDLDQPAPPHQGPEHHAEAADLASAVVRAMHSTLTPYQRRIAIALLVDDVPIDVLAERLDTTRGALYKTVHDARVRVRAALTAEGFLPRERDVAGAAGTRDRLPDRGSTTTTTTAGPS